MKKISSINFKNLVVLTAFLFVTNFAIAQAFKVFSSGDCKAYYNMTVDGTLSVIGRLTIDDYYVGPRIYPNFNNSGSVGTSSNAFNSITCYNVYNLSDYRQKENFKDLNNALSIVRSLKGLKYDLKKEFVYDESKIKDSKQIAKLEKERKNKIGFIAQDVYKVLPEVVIYDDSTDIYCIDYSKIVPVLVEAIKEMATELDQLKSNNLKSADLNSFNSQSDESAKLNQNIPNPFTENTRIDIYIPQSTNKANLYVYNMQGVQIKSFLLNERGNTSLTLEGNTLKAGMYLYTLITDGKEVDTKKMILTK